ncbi:chemotaxis protein CheB [Tahibacter soli]|uniref:protein-glutamate methylesterase n=1 Tax=Tahibacter soli TaxID=2983605 RepID=A0A9X3YKN7_9GAMM|nr:chemotaxis protein CheB [Tahibacter soli]MDC8012721.1 chemotaxis protein CheB [Tahibacter soli]
MSAQPSRPGVSAVAVGASAGGVEALIRLLSALPADWPAALLVVLHLPRDRPSLLVDLFAPRCALRVVEAIDKEPIVPGTAYIAPPDYHFLVEAGEAGEPPHAALSVDDFVQYSRPSIDVLFESAADVFGPRLAGVILTGANDDGAAGLRAVRRAGGVGLVQDPDEAHASAMPIASRDAGADFVLPLAGIVHWLQSQHEAVSP